MTMTEYKDLVDRMDRHYQALEAKIMSVHQRLDILSLDVYGLKLTKKNLGIHGKIFWGLISGVVSGIAVYKLTHT